MKIQGDHSSGESKTLRWRWLVGVDTSIDVSVLSQISGSPKRAMGIGGDISKKDCRGWFEGCGREATMGMPSLVWETGCAALGRCCLDERRCGLGHDRDGRRIDGAKPQG